MEIETDHVACGPDVWGHEPCHDPGTTGHVEDTLSGPLAELQSAVVKIIREQEDDTLKAELQDIGRRIIRVDVPPAHAGIMAALRRAFEAAASEPSDRDFAELLRRLN